MSSTPAGLQLQLNDGQPVQSRPTPLYGNIVSFSAKTGECTILSHVYSRNQIKKQGRAYEVYYLFNLATLPLSQTSMMLNRAIQTWLKERERSVEKESGNEDLLGPRVTFYDEEQLLAFRGKPPSQESLENGHHDAAQPKLRHHHQHRRQASRWATTPPKRATDVGLVWWTGDLHGKHM